MIVYGLNATLLKIYSHTHLNLIGIRTFIIS